MSAPTCSQSGRIALLRLRELSASQRAHVEGCAACTREIEALEGLILTAREVDAERVDEARSEQLRARLLDAARRTSSPRASRRPFVVAAVAVAAAVVIAVVAGGRIGATPSATAPSVPPSTEIAPMAQSTHGTVRASAGAHFTQLSDRPDEMVRLVDGAITVSVTPLEAGERFRVIVGDAEVEVRGTAFEIAASDDHLVSVEVLHGIVEVRALGAEPAVLHAGERWSRAPETEAAAELEGVSTDAMDEELAAAPRVHARPHAPAPSEAVVIAPTWTAASGFESGWSALHSGDPTGAARSFAEVVDRAPSDPARRRCELLARRRAVARRSRCRCPARARCLLEPLSAIGARRAKRP